MRRFPVAPRRAATLRGAALLCACCLLATLFATSAAAQTPPGAIEIPGIEGPVFEEEVQVSWVLVPVVVRGRGGFVDDLKKKRFRLEVDGRRVPIESFESSADAPLSLVVLQDLSGSMANGGKLEASRAAVQLLLARTRPGDEHAVAIFADEVLGVQVPFTGDTTAVREAIGSWDAYGKTALHDAVARLPEISSAGRHAKRAVLLVTDGVDNASTLTPEAARQLVRRAELPVYVFGIDADPEGAEGAEEYRFRDVLDQLARATGGRYFQIDDPTELPGAVGDVLEELREQYVLGFPADTAPVAWHSIDVELRRGGGAEIVTRRGYRGGPPLTESPR